MAEKSFSVLLASQAEMLRKARCQSYSTLGSQDEMLRKERRQSSPQLEMHRKERQELNDRLFTLRNLVPNLSRMDRLSILEGAIEHVKEMQEQVKQLSENTADSAQQTKMLEVIGNISLENQAVNETTTNATNVPSSQARNFDAERKRRDMINANYCLLHSLVPTSSNCSDKASIVGDAIEHVKELQMQVKQLQDKLGIPSATNQSAK